MRVFIDVSVLTLATFVTGIQRVTREIAVRLISQSELEIVLLHYHAAEDTYYRIDNQAFVHFYVNHQGIKEKMITREKVPLQEIGAGDVFFDLDAAWMCRMKRSYLLPILKKQGVRIIPHIYDIISITHPQYCLQRGVYNFMDYIGAHLQYADEIIVNAQATTQELKKLAKNVGCVLPTCTAVPLGADFHERGPVAEEKLDKELIHAVKSRPFILMVGTIEPRKNHKLLLDAYEKGLKDAGYNIIFAGYMGWNMEAFAEKLRAYPDFGKRIFHFEGLDDQGISYLYQNARFLAFCSYTEGFGLPIIEALMRGTPVIASDIPVSREVAGGYCDFFPQDDARGICEIVEFYDHNPEAYQTVKAKLKDCRFADWDTCFQGINRVITRNYEC